MKSGIGGLNIFSASGVAVIRKAKSPPGLWKQESCAAMITGSAPLAVRNAGCDPAASPLIIIVGDASFHYNPLHNFSVYMRNAASRSKAETDSNYFVNA
jgi:hypothetical protein